MEFLVIKTRLTEGKIAGLSNSKKRRSSSHRHRHRHRRRSSTRLKQQRIDSISPSIDLGPTKPRKPSASLQNWASVTRQTWQPATSTS
jgi:hypothetical protein